MGIKRKKKKDRIKMECEKKIECSKYHKVVDSGKCTTSLCMFCIRTPCSVLVELM